MYTCSECSTAHNKKVSVCSKCGKWGTLAPDIEEMFASTPMMLPDIDDEEEPRFPCGLEKMDYVLGGGFVIGSLVLLSGEPGIGKSTLAMQCADRCKGRVLYISGEETLRQIKLRAKRLGIKGLGMMLMNESDFEKVSDATKAQNPDLLIIDSIQRITVDGVSGQIGSVTQVREAGNRILTMAKSSDTTVLILCHVNKEGEIAGPKTLEHMVDAVMYFEEVKETGERKIYCTKNRFGGTMDDEGNKVERRFKMTGRGLV